MRVSMKLGILHFAEVNLTMPSFGGRTRTASAESNM